MLRSCTVSVVALPSEVSHQQPDLEFAAIFWIGIEMKHASFLIADDMIDKSTTSRRKPYLYLYLSPDVWSIYCNFFSRPLL